MKKIKTEILLVIFILVCLSCLTIFANAAENVIISKDKTEMKAGETALVTFTPEGLSSRKKCGVWIQIMSESDPYCEWAQNQFDPKSQNAQKGREAAMIISGAISLKINAKANGDCKLIGTWSCETQNGQKTSKEGINIIILIGAGIIEINPAKTCSSEGQCKATACDDKTETKGESAQNDWCARTYLTVGENGETAPARGNCCIVKAGCITNKGYILIDQKDESSKCMENSIITAPDAKEGKICCKNKEKVRESVKEPGTLGRLNSCFGKYTWWGKTGEDKILGDAAASLSKLPDKTECNTLKQNFLATIYNPEETGEKNMLPSKPEEKSNAIDKISNEISACRNAFAPKAGEPQLTGTTKDQMSSLKKVQDNLEKARGITAMTWTERGATFISCEIGMAYASKLAFGNYWAGPLFGTGGGMLASLGEGSGIFGPGKILSQDARAILGNAAGGFLASFTSPDSAANEMGSCAPETPIKGSQLCSTCNEDPYRLCTRERCNILGNCIPVPTAKGDQVVCIAGKCEDIGMPIFTKGNLEWYVDTDLNGSQPLTIQGGNIKTKINAGKNIPFNTKTIMINVTSDKPAKCRYILDKIGASFSEMTDFEENEFPALAGGLAGPQAVYIMLSGIITRGIDHNIFIKCQNSCGVEPNASYDQNIITFKLEQKPDQLPPNIIYVDPASGSMVRSDLQTVEASFWLDEKGDCRFADKSTNFSAFNYSKMIPFGTYNNPDSSVISGSCDNTKKCLDRNDTCARCTLKLDLSKGYELTNYTSTEFNTTKMYHLILRCNDLKNNVMIADDALDYILMTAPGYNITITGPPEDNMFTYDVRPEIQVTSDPRQTQCKYKIYNLTSSQPNPKWEDMTFIDNELGIVHTGRINETLDADPSPGHGYTIAALCRDKFNMEARAWRHLFIVEDIASPILIRTYHDSITGDFLVLETDEPSVCTYSFDSCNFNFSQGILMTGNEVIHGTYWKDKTFFIKCVDAWGNYPSATGGTKNPAFNYCTATLKPFEIPKIFL